MNCVFKELKRGEKCENGCGRSLPMDFTSDPEVECRNSSGPKSGDAIEELLTSYGITKEWYQSFKKEHGLPPICNCEARKEWMNKVSAAHPKIANLGVKIFDALKRK